MPRRLVRGLLASMAVAGVALAGAQPAQAGSGGGCNGTAVQACISLST
jgi:hypothetical protein